jgi:hypothetical protein
VQLNCANVFFNLTILEASGPKGSRAISGMTDSKATEEKPTENFQKLVYNVEVGEFTTFAQLIENTKEPFANVGHVNASIISPSAIVVIDAFIESKEDPAACVVKGTAFSIPL